MYEDLVKEMQELDNDLIRNEEKIMKSIKDGTSAKENARINKELAKTDFRVISLDDALKITGVKYGKRKK